MKTNQDTKTKNVELPDDRTYRMTQDIMDQMFQPNPKLYMFLWLGEPDPGGKPTMWIANGIVNIEGPNGVRPTLVRTRIYEGDTFTVAIPLNDTEDTVYKALEGIYGLLKGTLIHITGPDTLQLRGLKSRLIDQGVSHPMMSHLAE